MYTLLDKNNAVEWIRTHLDNDECRKISIKYGIEKGYIFPLPGTSDFYLAAWTYDYLNSEVFFIDSVDKISDKDLYQYRCHSDRNPDKEIIAEFHL